MIIMFSKESQRCTWYQSHDISSVTKYKIRWDLTLWFSSIWTLLFHAKNRWCINDSERFGSEAVLQLIISSLGSHHNQIHSQVLVIGKKLRFVKKFTVYHTLKVIQSQFQCINSPNANKNSAEKKFDCTLKCNFVYAFQLFELKL